MKYLIMPGLFLLIAVLTEAQTGGSTGTKRTNTNKPTTPAQRGTGQYHGSKDTTPGSPMGTGGTGSGDMSGSPAASAIDTQDQPSQKQQPANSSQNPSDKTTGKYHGSRDTTPGSPMGTGGTGGGDMSGSPAGSAIQTQDEKSKASGTGNTKSGNKGAASKTSNRKNAAGSKQATNP